jgi:hypothetical protein
MSKCLYGAHECVVGICPSAWNGEYEGYLCQPSIPEDKCSICGNAGAQCCATLTDLATRVELAYANIWPCWDAFVASGYEKGALALHDAINELATLAREGARK